MSEFKVGDKVEYVGSASPELYGEVGEVVNIECWSFSPPSIGVRFAGEYWVMPPSIVELSEKGTVISDKKHSHYYKDVSNLDEIDVYKVCELFEVDDPSGCVQHAIKKLLCGGKRGAKSSEKDLQEAVDTLQRKIDMGVGDA